MLDFIKKYLYFIIAALIIIILVVFRAVREYRLSKAIYQSKQDQAYVPIRKTVGVNEYTNINMPNDTIVKLYFSDFKAYAIGDVEGSYLRLDESYREKRFSNIEDYKRYIQSLDLVNAKATKFNIISNDDYTIYIVYDNNNNYYAFKVTGVLEYKVYLDNNTVEIR